MRHRHFERCSRTWRRELGESAVFGKADFDASLDQFRLEGGHAGVVGRDGVKFEVSAKKHRARSVCIGDVPPQASADAHSRCRRHFLIRASTLERMTVPQSVANRFDSQWGIIGRMPPKQGPDVEGLRDQARGQAGRQAAVLKKSVERVQRVRSDA
jgi:hypothetical protein